MEPLHATVTQAPVKIPFPDVDAVQVIPFGDVAIWLPIVPPATHIEPFHATA